LKDVRAGFLDGGDGRINKVRKRVPIDVVRVGGISYPGPQVVREGTGIQDSKNVAFEKTNFSLVCV
jgi:hypothetical protein